MCAADGCIGRRERRFGLSRRSSITRRRHDVTTPWSYLLLLLYYCSSLPQCARSQQSENCRQPCENANCPPVGDCPFGTFEFCGGCCIGCARGLGQLCDRSSPVPFGPCGDGLECVGGSSSSAGLCVRTSTPSSSQGPVIVQPTPSPSPSPLPPPSPSPLPPSSPSPTLPPVVTTASTLPLEPPTNCSGDEEDMSVVVECRPTCSVDYCSETETKKKRICSGAGLSPVVPGRSKCQHTTCAACFLLRGPNCTTFSCPDPPTKDCLRSFYGCVRDHYFGPTALSNLIRLEDPEARTTPGRIVCFIPVLDPHSTTRDSTTHRASSSSSSSGMGEREEEETGEAPPPSRQP